MIAPFNLQEEGILCRTIAAAEREQGTSPPPLLNSDKKYLSLFFSVFKIKIFLSRNMKKIVQKVPK